MNTANSALKLECHSYMTHCFIFVGDIYVSTEELQVVDSYSSFNLTITSLLPHPVRADSILVTTTQGLYEINKDTCLFLYGSTTLATQQQPSDLCYNQEVTTVGSVEHLHGLEYVDFTVETLLPDSVSFKDIENAILIADREAHCVQLFDLDTKTDQVFVGTCGQQGSFSSEYEVITNTKINNPMSVLYLNKHQNEAGSYGQIIVYRSCYNQNYYGDHVCGTWCFLTSAGNNNKVYCSKTAIELDNTNSDPLGTAFLYQSNNLIYAFIYNSACKSRCDGLVEFKARACILSVAFLNRTAFMVNTEHMLQLSNMTATGWPRELQLSNTCSHYNGRCRTGGFSLLRNHALISSSNILGYNFALNEIHLLGIAEVSSPSDTTTSISTERPTSTSKPSTTLATGALTSTQIPDPRLLDSERPKHLRFSGSSYRNCAYNPIKVIRKLTFDTCAYSCIRFPHCNSFSYTPQGDCSLYDFPPTDATPINQSNLEVLCYTHKNMEI